MGRGELTFERFRTERLEFEERTSDPADTEEGEAWLRTDVAPETDQLGTLRVDNGSGTWDVPVFTVGTSQTGVHEALRVPIGGQTGYIPVTQPSDAQFQALRAQHDGSVHALHNDVEPGAIPDSGTNQWYIDEGSGTTLNDSQGSVTATISGASWVSDSQAVGGYHLSHDGVDDTWQTDSAVLTTPFTVCGWVRFDDMSAFANGIVTTANFASLGSNSGFYVDSDGDGALLTVIEDGSAISGHPYSTTGNWGFFALNMQSTQHRLITFDNTQELGDTTDTSVGYDANNSLLVGDTRDGGELSGDTDFYVVSNGSLLSKQEITDLWNATKR